MRLSIFLISAWAALMILPTSFAQNVVLSIPEKASIDPDFFKKYDPKAPSLRPESVPPPLSTLSRAKELYAKASAEIKNLENEIRKNEDTIQKTEKLISLAREEKKCQSRNGWPRGVKQSARGQKKK